MVLKNIEVWKNRLLDTTKRNQSINFKAYKSSTAELIYPEIEDFFNLLENKRKLEFADIFQDYISLEDDDNLFISEESEENKQDSYIIIDGIELKEKDVYSKEELLPVINNFQQNLNKSDTTNYIYTSSSKKRQRLALTNLMKRARLAKEENAINILYLAIGFLNWFDSDQSEVLNSSPICLIPIEIERASLDAPIKLKIQDPELQTNESLIRAMSKEFGIDLNYDFSEDETLYENFKNYTSFIKEKLFNSRWYLTENMHLGLFSFSKINMYKDIEENQSLLENNPLVKALSGDSSDYHEDGKLYSEEELDSLINPLSYFQALDADSSQELAIQAAISGKSFVLQGPPGTGKSQTITNIISELISRGKHVLFVAEKRAALDVVYSNLKKAKLNDYALPLHNSKIDKKSVIKDLNQSLIDRQYIHDISEDQLDKLSYDYKRSQTNLNNYANELLLKRMPLGKNIYELIGEYLKLEKSVDIMFDIKNYSEIDGQTLLEIKERINTFEKLYQNIYPHEKHPFYGLQVESLSLLEIESLLAFLKDLKTQSTNLLDEISSQFNFLKPSCLGAYNVLENLAFIKNILNINHYEDNLIKKIESENSEVFLETEIKKYLIISDINKDISSNENRLFKYYDKSLLEQDIDSALKIFRRESSWFKRLFSSEFKTIKRTIFTFQKFKRTKYKELLEDINLAHSIQVGRNNLQQSLIDCEYKTSSVNFDEITKTLTYYLKINNHIHFSNVEINTSLKECVTSLIDHKSLNVENLMKLEKSVESVLNLIKAVQIYFKENIVNFNNVIFDELNQRITFMIENPNKLSDYLSFNYSLSQGIALGIEDFYNTIVRLKLKNDLLNIFMKRFYSLILDFYFEKSQTLKYFARDDFDQYQEIYKQADKQMIQFAKYQIDKMIAKNTPSIEGIEGNNIEVQILRREANKSRKIKPIRVLFKEIPHLIMNLKPCLMMSPLSVSSFLKSTDYRFDTVIFDEASQVRPESALGAIYRSKQAIIVGDKEQLPPTSFFDVADEEIEDEEVDAYAFDSILELAEGVLKPISLKWHYRSKFEELIYVSNQFIYKDLITFPSKKKPSNHEGIDFYYIENGRYDNRENIIEAKRVAELVMDHVKINGQKKTLGVVTFSQSQQRVIEKEIEKLRRLNEEYEMHFSENIENPFFVKSIETVQGDERDTIIISVGYGRNLHGNISMNFGPLNKDGGYRRLNVAISRAKSNVILVSSLKDFDIDLNRTTSKGPMMLKEYLRYAEYGQDEKVDSFIRDEYFDSFFEEDVYNEIKKMGYLVHTQVGSSKYKIDLAVLHPNSHTHYVIGIECDGATYHNSKASRDRDRLRQDVLEMRGWKIYRIWSTDWFKHREREIERLKNKIINAVTNFDKTVKTDVKEIKVVVEKTQKKPKVIDFNTYPNYEKIVYKYYDETKIDALVGIFKELSPIHRDEIKKVVPPFYERQKFTKVVDTEFNRDLIYVKRNIQLGKRGDYFIVKDQPIKFRKVEKNSTRRPFEFIYLEELKDGILRILEVVKLIGFEDLLFKVLEYCGFSKSSSSIRNIFNQCLNELRQNNQLKIDNQVIELL